MEPIARHEPVAKKGNSGLDKKCRIHVHSRTKRLADPDGRSCKAAIDGIVLATLLQDDSSEFVTEVLQSQEKISGKNAKEETIIEIVFD